MMERLTIHNGIPKRLPVRVEAIYKKLAAYEDIGLEPEDILDICYRFAGFLSDMTNNRMSKLNYTLEAMIDCARDAQESNCENFCDLKQAEDEGRLVVLPCKIGDKVFYRCRNGEIKKGTISMLQQKADGSWKFRVSDRLGVSDWPAEDLGKLWFLTREEAEKAMEGGADDA